MDEQDNDRAVFALGLLIGAALGFGLALLSAPKVRAELRRTLEESAAFAKEAGGQARAAGRSPFSA